MLMNTLLKIALLVGVILAFIGYIFSLLPKIKIAKNNNTTRKLIFYYIRIIFFAVAIIYCLIFILINKNFHVL